MRILYFIFLVFLGPTLFSQVQKIKIKKQEALYKVSLAGVDSGFANLKDILKDKTLNVTNQKDGIKIYAYQAFVYDYKEGVKEEMFPGKSAKLSDDLIKALEKNPDEIRIRRIQAYNSFNETIQLNDIVIS